MKIRISTIPPEGLKLSVPLSLDALNDRMNEGGEQEIKFLSPPQLEVVIIRRAHGGELSGEVRTTYEQPCSRCAEEKERELVAPLNITLKRSPEGHALPDDDIGVVYFQEDHVDIEEIVQETIILALSIFWSPPTDCEGICTLCNRRVEYGVPVAEVDEKKNSAGTKTQSLGDLLQTAMGRAKR